jgi:hypothetical protein
MPRIPLFGGAYQSRSLIANAQRSVNLFPEMTPPQEAPPTPVTQLPTPGLTILAESPIAAPGRGLYLASDNTLFAVIGNKVYTISAGWTFTLLGTIGTSVNPVGMKDNEETLFLVDGSSTGYTVTLGTSVLHTVTDPNYHGADRVDYLDTFLLFNKPGTPEFYSTLSNTVAFDENDLYFDFMTGEPTNCVCVVTLHGYIWVIGERATEVWFNAGDTNVFPFARTPAQILQHGCIAKYSPALSSGGDDSQSCVLWLSSNEDGGGLLLKGQNFQASRVSMYAIEEEWRKYATLSDAQGFCYQQGGHQFYMLSFPTADKTWCLDLTTGEWHERVYIDSNGAEHRHRAACADLRLWRKRLPRLRNRHAIQIRPGQFHRRWSSDCAAPRLPAHRERRQAADVHPVYRRHAIRRGRERWDRRLFSAAGEFAVFRQSRAQLEPAGVARHGRARQLRDFDAGDAARHGARSGVRIVLVR